MLIGLLKRKFDRHDRYVLFGLFIKSFTVNKKVQVVGNGQEKGGIKFISSFLRYPVYQIREKGKSCVRSVKCHIKGLLSFFFSL